MCSLEILYHRDTYAILKSAWSMYGHGNICAKMHICRSWWRQRLQSLWIIDHFKASIVPKASFGNIWNICHARSQECTQKIWSVINVGKSWPTLPFIIITKIFILWHLFDKHLIYLFQLYEKTIHLIQKSKYKTIFKKKSGLAIWGFVSFVSAVFFGALLCIVYNLLHPAST